MQDLLQWRSTQDELLMFDRNTSIHEAGHVFAARTFGFAVPWVSIDSKFLSSDYDPWLIENRAEAERACGMTRVAVPDVLLEIKFRGHTVNSFERDTIRNFYIKCLSGPLAEKSFSPNYDVRSAHNDVKQASMVLKCTQPTKARYKQDYKKYLREARNFVEVNRMSIFHLGVAIHTKKTIFGINIDAEIQKAKLRAAA